MKPAVQSNQKNNEEISHHSCQVHGQDQDKEGDLIAPVTGQPQQDELTHPLLFYFTAAWISEDQTKDVKIANRGNLGLESVF